MLISTSIIFDDARCVMEEWRTISDACAAANIAAISAGDVSILSPMRRALTARVTMPTFYWVSACGRVNIRAQRIA